MSSKLYTFLAQSIIQSRHHSMLFGLFKHAFNDVDRDRLRAVGPDRLCAEWILKNGGAVKLADRPQFLIDYMELPAETFPVKVQQLDASRSSVTAQGFNHLRDCRYIRRMVLDDCPLMENGALEKLRFLTESLVELQVSNCPGVQDDGLHGLVELMNLKKLCLFNLNNVKDLEGIIEQELVVKLPNCSIVRECRFDRCEAEN